MIGLPDTGGLVLRKLIDLGAGPDRLPTFVTDGLRVPNLYQSVDPTATRRRPRASAARPWRRCPGVDQPTFADEFAAFAPGSPDDVRALRVRLRVDPRPRRAGHLDRTTPRSSATRSST